MKYESLDTLPMNIFLEIKKNSEQNIMLLSDQSDMMSDVEKQWLKLDTEFTNIFNRLFHEGIPKYKIEQELLCLKTKFLIIHSSIESMKFMYNKDLVEVLLIHGVEITEENRLEDLEKAKKKNDVYIEFIEFLPEDIETFDFLDYHALWCIVLDKFEDLNKISVRQYLNNYEEGINKIKSNNT